MPHSALENCNIAIIGQIPTYEPQNLKAWIEHAGGRYTSTLTDSTTHAVMSDKTYKNGSGPVVQQILARREERQQYILMMRPQWLIDSVGKKNKLSEGKGEYSWEKYEENIPKGEKGKGKNEPRTAAGLMSQVFTESTEQFVDGRDVRRAEKQREAEKKARKEEEEARQKEFEAQTNQMRIKEVAAVFRMGAQKARNHLLSDNYHIYTDRTGFHYDVAVTRVVTRKNTNERYCLTIYESNTEPAVYAVNCQYSGSGLSTTNNLIANIGSNFPTAFRCFKRVFKEKTRVDWEDRIKAAVEREKEAQAVREGKIRRRPQEQDAPFVYHPPHYGPQGEELATGNEATASLQSKAAPSAGKQWAADGGECIMSGGNGETSGCGHSQPLQPQTVLNGQHTHQGDSEFEKMMLAEERVRVRDNYDGLGNNVLDEPFNYPKQKELEEWHQQEQDKVEAAAEQVRQAEAAKMAAARQAEETRWAEEVRQAEKAREAEQPSKSAEAQEAADAGDSDVMQGLDVPLDNQIFDHTQMAQEAQGPPMHIVNRHGLEEQKPIDELVGEEDQNLIQEQGELNGKLEAEPDYYADFYNEVQEATSIKRKYQPNDHDGEHSPPAKKFALDPEPEEEPVRQTYNSNFGDEDGIPRRFPNDI